jgi:hypothetical protein
MAKKQTEVAIKNGQTLPQFTEVITKSGLEHTKAERYALGYQPLMKEVLDQAGILKPLDKTNPEHSAKARRVSIDLGKICSRLTAKKKEDKDILLIETRLIDGLFNVAESTARLTQKEADEIVSYLENIEKERLAKLADSRREELEKYEAITTYLPLDIMSDEQFDRCLEDAKLAFNARKEAAEKAERERLERIRLEEEAEKERLRLQAERIEAERLEAIRIKEELAAKEAQLEKERNENEAKLAKEREIARKEAEKLAKENEAKLAEQQRLAKIQSDKLTANLAEQKRLNDIEAKKQAEILAKQKAEAEKLAKELQAKKDAEAKIEAEIKAALLAPDKEKVNQLYISLRSLTIPKFESEAGIAIAEHVTTSIAHLLNEIKELSKKLS